MQDINAEYAAAFKWLQNHDSEHLNCYDKIDPAAYPEIISKIIGLTELTIEICGSWVWLTGKTWLYAEQLKAAGVKKLGIGRIRLKALTFAAAIP